MISANIFTIDEITSNISSYIQKGLDESGSTNIKLTLGSFTGIKILSGEGPSIKIKVLSTGKIDSKLNSEFIAQGINQTIHRIYLQVNCQVNILTPFKTIEQKVSSQIMIAENVIIGKIPSTFYNFEGMEGSKETLKTIK